MFDLLEIVALKKNFPDHDLREGDVGTVVEVYDADNVEVEFVEASGYTRALLTLSCADVRNLAPDEILAVRAVGSSRP